MSVINQMLRDLDHRQQPVELLPPVDPPKVANSGTSRRWLTIVSGLLVAAAIGAAGSWYLQRYVANQLALTETPLALPEAPVDADQKPATVIKLRPATTPADEVKKQPENRPDEADVTTRNEAAAPSADAATPPVAASKASAQVDYLPLKNVDTLPAVAAVPKSVAAAPAPVKQAAQPTPADGVRKTTKPVKQIHRQDLFQQAESLLAQGRMAEAEAKLRQQIAKRPYALNARALLVTLTLRGDRTEEATRLLDKGLRIKPGYRPFVMLRARLHIQQGESDAAVRLLEPLLRSGRADTQLLGMLGVLYQQQERFTAARRSWLALLQQQPESARAWAGLGIALEGVDDPQGALQAYRRAVAARDLPAELAGYVRQRMLKLEQGQ